ncbi:MAG3720 family protein [Mycoplasmopsis columboralis]|uniref:Cell division protein FtsA n=1 Tax=Mycoplasmopsis columboralis TaxID=171282 RepID=A0A449B605_9BACT|nr:hypothetical protein [Mycoplasmopsis columboralis]VEU76040.1 Uncharacterised protein [Mycoplasmopsis columboralis]
MQKSVGIFHLSNKALSFQMLEQINGNYLFDAKQFKRVIMPSNVLDIENYLKDIHNTLTTLNNQHLSLNVIIDDSILESVQVKLIKTTLLSEDISKLDDASVALEQLITQQIAQFENEQSVTKIATAITYEYLLYKSNNQVKIYHEFPKGKKFTKIVAKTSFAYQPKTCNYKHILSLFQALPSDELNVMLSSQINSVNLKDNSQVNLSVQVNQQSSVLALVYNGAIINYKKLLVGTDNLIYKIAIDEHISFNQARNKVKYLTKIDTSTTIEDQNLSLSYSLLKFFESFIQEQMIDFVAQKYIAPEKLNTLSFSGELDWMNNYFEKMSFLPSKIGFSQMYKPLSNTLNPLEKTQEPLTFSVLNFLNTFVWKQTNTVNTISSHYDLQHTKKQRFLLLRELFANLKLV